MAYAATEGPHTTLASLAHLGAILGPVIPLVVWLSRRRDDEYVAREAAKATNLGMAVLVGFAAATLVELYVPLVGFLGRLAQLVVLVVAGFLCVQAFRNVRRGSPTTYPIYFKVVKTHE